MATRAATKEEGVVYVSSQGLYYSAPDIDADKIRDVLQNTYVREQFDKLASQIFSGDYLLTAKDADDEADEELSKAVRTMVESPGVRLWSRMRQCWEDARGWGPAILNPVWSRDGAEVVLSKLRRLPPHSFARRPMSQMHVYSDILQGITLDEADNVQYWQTQDAFSIEPKILKGCVMVKDPRSSELAGSSMLVPLVPLISMLDFCWKCQMQKINRVGAPIFFIKVANPKAASTANGNVGDTAFAQHIVKNWGSSSAFHLRENMEVVELNLTDNDAALATIAMLEARVAAHFSPAASIQKSGAALGGNAAAEKEMVDDWIDGERAWVEDEFEAILNEYLTRNGYVGYHIELTIGAEQGVPGDLELRQAQVGWQTRALTVNEVRERLGSQALDDAGVAALGDEWSAIAPPPSASPFGAAPTDALGFEAGHDKEHVPNRHEVALDGELAAIYDATLDKLAKVL